MAGYKYFTDQQTHEVGLIARWMRRHIAEVEISLHIEVLKASINLWMTTSSLSVVVSCLASKDWRLHAFKNRCNA